VFSGWSLERNQLVRGPNCGCGACFTGRRRQLGLQLGASNSEPPTSADGQDALARIEG
jgi:hypothetical protein